MTQCQLVSSVVACLTILFSGCSGCGRTGLVAKDVCVGVAGAQADLRDGCDNNAACADHYACRDVKDKQGVKCCQFVDRECNTEADCCPGQACPSERKKCRDRFNECVTDSDCGDLGDKVCELYSDMSGPSNRCRLRPCGASGECPAGQSCFQNECVAELPCGGQCEPGKACVPSTGRCQDYSNPEGRPMAACPMSCTTGFIATFADTRDLWDRCTLPNAKCVCAELPALVSNDLGRFSSLASNGADGLMASMYDGKYGDLVVYRYDATGKRVGVDYVDGVPVGQVKYGPSGARGGVVEAGPDVGRYTDIAVRNGVGYVSYYDVTNTDLKVAIRQGDTWSTHRVDGADGDVGLYTSIDVDADGMPGIAYFMRAAEASFNVSECPAPAPTAAVKNITALKFARAKVAVPTTEGDWVIRTLACLAKPAQPCDGCSGVCADTGSGPACLMSAPSCTPACDTNTEACVLVNNAARCGRKYNPSLLSDIPLGVGVFASLAFNGKNAVIAYMQRTGTMASGRVVPDGDLFAVQVDAQNTRGTPVLIQGVGDVGYFPDVKIDPNTRNIGIAFHDFSAKRLKFYFAPVLQAGVTLETIDDGVDAARPGEQSFVGTDSALVFGPQPNLLWVVYQDATRGDLKLAKRTTKWAVEPTLATDGAVGFFADGVFANGRLWATHARLKARLVGGQPELDNSFLLQQGPEN